LYETELHITLYYFYHLACVSMWRTWYSRRSE